MFEIGLNQDDQKWLSFIEFAEKMTYEKNLYRRMLIQNMYEISFHEKAGLNKKYVAVLRRIVKPVTFLEVIFFPVIVMITNLTWLRIRKKKIKSMAGHLYTGG